MPGQGSGRLTRSRRPWGFTLIEMMIVIAILAIWLVGQSQPANFSLHALDRESDYHQALTAAQRELTRLKTADVAHEPPETVQVGKGGWIQLHHAPLVGEVQVFSGDGPVKPESLQAASGRVQVAAKRAGQRLIVAYSYAAGDSGEAYSVPKAGPAQVVLRNLPIQQVTAVWLAQGDRLTPLPGWRQQGDDRLSLPEGARGHVVMVDYRGGRVQTRITGEWLRNDLKPVALSELARDEASGDHKLLTLASPVKLFTVEQGYAGDQQLVLQLLRTRP